MRAVIVAVFISLTVVAVSQDCNPDAIVTPPGPPHWKPSESPPRWDKGVVEGRTYKNASVGVELTPPPGLEFVGDPELKERSAGTFPLLVTITAASERVPLTARKVLSFYADALAYYPPTRRTTDAYVQRIAANQRFGGYAPVGTTSQGKLGGVAFERQDFKKDAVYETVFVKACDAQALVFIFAAADEETVNRLSAATELKLDPPTSGCFFGAAAPPPGAASAAHDWEQSGNFKMARVISSPQPDYPQQARKGQVAGSIVISMVVGGNGRTCDIQVRHGISPELDQAAVEAVRKWQFQPATKDGKPVSVRIGTQFDFQP
jgi:TonB family protein